MQLHSHDQMDIDYLHQEQIGGVIADGLTAIYRCNPKYPIDFLAKWLLSHSKTLLEKQAFNEQHQHKQRLLKKHAEDLLNEKHRLQETLEQQREQQREIDDFRNRIKGHHYHLELLQQEFAEFLLKQQNLSGVYICHFDQQKQAVDLETNDSDIAHISKTLPKLLHYVAASDNHQELVGRMLLPEQGMTYEVLKPQVAEDGSALPPKSLYIPDVIKELKVHYHKWPKLGAYFAVPMFYQSCLYEDSFDQGLESQLAYLTKKEQQDKSFEAKRLEFEHAFQLKQDAHEDTQELEDEFEAFKETIEELAVPEFHTVKQEYIVCTDTLGQDREISTKDRAKIEEFVTYYGSCWELREQAELLHSITEQIDYLNSLPHPIEQIILDIQADEDNYVEERVAENLEYYTGLQQDDERTHAYELDCMRLANIRERLVDPAFHAPLLGLSKRRIIKFPGIIQSALYLIGYHKNDINILGTNVLDWRKLRSRLDAQLLGQILAYQHKGPNPRQPHPWGMVDRVSRMIQNYDQESVDNYCLPYGVLLKYLFLICRLRREDIELRRHNLEKLRESIVQITEQRENMQSQKETALEEAKGELSEEELETFNEEEWRAQYDLDHPLPEIPEDREDEVDADYQFD